MSTATTTKQVTVDVPEDRVPEFYAWYARFLAGHRRRGHGRGHGCRHGRTQEQAARTEAPEA